MKACAICVWLVMCAPDLAAEPPQPTSNAAHPGADKLETLLGDLIIRCNKMRKMSTEVYDGVVTLHKMVAMQPDKKPSLAHKQAALKLADKQKAIIAEATKAIALLNAEGSAVAFPEVFEQVLTDMRHVRHLLKLGKVGMHTQNLQKDIVDTLAEMVGAMKK